MRVAYLGIKGIPARAGADRVVEAIVTRMPAHGIFPTVYCDQTYTPADVVVPGVNLVRLPAIPGKFFRALTLNLLAGFHAVLFGDYELIHLHNVEASYILPLLRLKYKVISTSHGAAYWRAKWGSVAKQLIRMMDLPFMALSNEVTFVSAKDARAFSTRYDRQTTYIPNGVGVEYSPNVDKAQTLLDHHNLKPGGYFIFVAGRIEPTKGAHLAIEAINHLEEETPLLVVGDDTQVPDYSRWLKENAGPMVRSQPLIKDPEILFGLMASARCLIFPSIVEAMSMVLLESAFIGVPIVCSDIPENRQIMLDDAIYFKSESIESLAQQLSWVLHHSQDVMRIAQRARERIRKEYSWDSIISRYVLLYQKLAGCLEK